MMLTLFSAGSLRGVLPEVLTALAVEAHCRCGPAGLLGAEIRAGAVVDVFLSADRKQIRALGPRVLESRPFLRNRLVLVAPRALAAGASVLSLLTRADLRLATSTPGADPGGDYAWAVFRRLEALQPGQGEALARRARPLVGGPNSAPLPPGVPPAIHLLATGQADLFLGYGHGAAAINSSSDYVALELPPELAVPVLYVGATLTAAAPARELLAALTRPPAPTIFRRQGFLGL